MSIDEMSPAFKPVWFTSHTWLHQTVKVFNNDNGLSGKFCHKTYPFCDSEKWVLEVKIHLKIHLHVMSYTRLLARFAIWKTLV